MTRNRRKRGITPWKKTALKVCLLWLIMAAGIHLYRMWKASKFEDQREATRWGSSMSSAQVSAFLPTGNALREESIRELEYKINTALAQDSIKLTATGPDAKLWQDCYSGLGSFTLRAGRKTVDVEAVGTGGAFFTFHPLKLSAGSYYLSDSLMKDEILLDEETAWKLFGAFDVIGRTVQVEDMHLRVAGVYKKDEGRLYDEAGLAEYLVFVQYKTLVQYGGGGAGMTGQDMPSTASRPADAAIAQDMSVTASRPAGAAIAQDMPGTTPSPFGVAANNSDVKNAATKETAVKDAAEIGTLLAAEETVDIGLDDGNTGDSGAAEGTGAAGAQESGAAPSASGDGQSEGGDDSSGGNTNNNTTQSSEFVGTSNTAFKDTGKITVYEIVMPNPVEGYAAATVEAAIGDDVDAIVVDNTNRFGERNLLKDLREFALLGMRREGVRYPYWENVAMGWETIFAALFLLECLLILMTVLLILWMIIHWYRHKTWTIAGSIRSLQESAYERQSRKKYPEYYERRDGNKTEEEAREADDGGEESAHSAKGTDDVNDAGSADAAHSDAAETTDNENGPALIEEKDKIPFERIPDTRKAVEYETLHQDDQHSDGSSTGAVLDGMRQREQ